MNDAARFARIREILPGARQLEREERSAYLDRKCGDDVELRRELEELLAEEGSGALLRTGGPVAQADPEALDELLGRDRSKPPSQVGPYHLREELGRGGMGVVYRAEQFEPLKREVALKLVKRGMDTDAVIARFEAERQTLARMEHPNIARVLDAGATEDGRPYFVMELVRGLPITRFCDERTLGPSERLDLFLQACRAVQHAHQRGALHRDIKPSNVMAFADAEGIHVKVIDFGIAKAIEDPVPGASAMTHAGQLLGTPEYMSPEQAGTVDFPVDTRSDVYSLGALLYELLSGRRPYEFRRYSFEEIQRTFREQEPLKPSTAITRAEDPQTPGDASTSDEIGRLRGRTPERLRRELSGDIDNIVLMAMHKDPERRYASVDALAEDIRRYRRGLPVLARADSWSYRTSKFLRRHAVSVSFAATALLALVAFAVYSTVQSARLARERDRAVAAESEAAAEARTAREVSDFLVGLFQVSDPDESRGRTITAREILEEGARRLDTELQDQPVVNARLRRTIGEVYQNLGLLPEAREQVERSLELRRRELDPGDPEVADGLVLMAFQLREEGKPEEAMPLLQEALRIQRAAYGDEHPAINTTLYHTASCFEELGRFAEAIALYREVLELDRKLLAPDDPAVAESLNNLAIALHSYGEYAEADSLYRESLALHRRYRGEDHPETATSMANLSNLVFNQFDRVEGVALAESSLAIRRRVLGNEHPATAISAGNLGIKLHILGRNEEAEALLVESLETKQRTQGERHPSTAHAWLLLSLAQLGQEKWDDAERSSRMALEIFRETMPVGHNSIARALDASGRTLVGRGRLDEAESPLAEALRIRRDALPVGHRERIDSMIRMGDLYRETNRPRDAEKVWREAYEDRRLSDGEDDSKALALAAKLRDLYVELGNREMASLFSGLADPGP